MRASLSCLSSFISLLDKTSGVYLVHSPAVDIGSGANKIHGYLVNIYHLRVHDATLTLGNTCASITYGFAISPSDEILGHG